MSLTCNKRPSKFAADLPLEIAAHLGADLQVQLTGNAKQRRHIFTCCIKPDARFTCTCTTQLPLRVVVPAQGAADLAEHSFYEYQRLVQKEAEPELIIQLPNRGDETDGAEARTPEFESEDAKVQRDVDLVVTVAFTIEQPNCGLQFQGLYACTDNQVGL